MEESGEVNVPSNVLQSEDWVKRWEDRQIGFHRTYIHPFLEKHLPSMVNGRTKLKVFVPLCGKSLDIKWLSDQGHHVVGVEVSEMAIQEFSDEQGVPFTKEDVPAVDGILFQNEDKSIQIYCCDLFKLTKDICGQFDGIWDRGSMVAINNEDRERYSSLLKTLMAPDCSYLLSALQYDETKYGGPPHNLGDETIYELFGNSCTVKEVEDDDAFEESKHTKWGISALREKIFVISPK